MMKRRIVKKGGSYFLQFFAQGGTKKILSPAGKTLKAARQLLKSSMLLNKDSWRMKERPVDEEQIGREALAFRAAETRRFNASRKIALVTDWPDRFLPLKDGGLNPTAAMITHNGFSYDVVTSPEIEAGALMNYDVALFPGGFGYIPTPRLAKQIKDYIRGGGGYFGLCAGAFLPLPPCHGIKGSGLSLISGGYEYFREHGIADVMLDPSDPLAKGIESTKLEVVYALYNKPAVARRHTVRILMLRGNGPLLLAKGKTRVAGYFDSSLPYAAIIRGEYGRGRIVVSSVHPDMVVADFAGKLATPADALANRKLAKNAILYCGGIG
ncbi:MAG: hypothetical protein PHW60_11875 [Kiritimatiellae bacterium]|nr:hypothetical protein [Kiritimatiellia bacterium]